MTCLKTNLMTSRYLIEQHEAKGETMDKSRRLVALAILILFGLLTGCMETFDDDTMSLVKKPEILAVVLDPPEAAPGEAVRTCALVVDGQGVVTESPILWTVGDSEGDLTDTFEFTAQRGTEDLVDEEGFSSQMLSLMVILDPAAMGEMDLMDVEQAGAALQRLVREDAVRVGMRTLLVNERESRNRNPEITSLILERDNGEQVELETLSPFEDDAMQKRLELAARAPEIPAQNTVHFLAELEDDGRAEDLLVQWIGTGGDFGARRETEQEWSSGKVKEADESLDEQDLRGEELVDARLDPNLHSLFLIVRDTGADGNNGQSYVEFFVRVVPE